jgi:hypothetical protein
VDISDCDSSTSQTTFWTITNASSAPVVAHVTVWTDWSVPEVDFDIYLTGYDVQSYDMRNLFCSGDVPVTYYGKNDEGPFSFDPGSSPSACGTTAGDPPRYNTPAITGAFLDHLNWMFTGQPGVDGNCGGSAEASGYAHGYVTIDANTNCSLNFPSQAAYWTSGVTQNTEAGNVLMGDYQYLNLDNGTSEGFTMVHIEAFAEIAAGAGPSFYSRYLADGSDGREPLPTTWAGRYNSGGAVNATWFQIWRTGGTATSEGSCSSNPFSTCNGTDQCAGLDIDFAINWDNNENVEIGTGGVSGSPAALEICVDYETQNMNVHGSLTRGLAASFDNGWYYLNLQSNCTDGQAYLTLTQTLDFGGTFSGGWDGVALDGSCTQFSMTAPTTRPAQPTGSAGGANANPRLGGFPP